MSDAVLEVENVTMRYNPGDDPAVRDVRLVLREGEMLTLVGPSGCGKTTLLRLIAGFERPETGRIVLHGDLLSTPDHLVPPERRNVGMVFQDLALFPHMTVRENVAFGIKGRENQKHRMNEVLELVGLSGKKDRYPGDLSGGQQQRVALARSLVVQPDVLLMDEPFNNLDKKLRRRMRREVQDILQEENIPTLFVTHDQREALHLGNRIGVMHDGAIEQIDRPEQIIIDPASRFVANFLGPTDFLPARQSGKVVETEIGLLPLSQVDTPGGDEFEIMIRSDDLTMEPVNKKEANGVVEKSEFLGGEIRYRIRLSSGNLIHSHLTHNRQLDTGTPVQVQLEPGHKLMGFTRDASSRDDPGMQEKPSGANTPDQA